MFRWGMIINLNRCIGCYSCMVACKQEHFLAPGVFWNRVLVGETGTYPKIIKHIYPVLCNHCKEAPCVEVCPTGASTKREDGIVIVDRKKCAGCGNCVVACPYQNRSICTDTGKEYFPGQGLTELEEMRQELYPLESGTAQKCNFCAERIDAGVRKGLKPGVDWDATPVCVNACPSKARCFGDLDDPESEISSLIKEKRGVEFHQEFGTGPSVFYALK